MVMVKVEIITPKKWWMFAKYQIVDDLVIANVRVPAGFVTDGTTLSRWWSVIGLFVVICAHWYPGFWLFVIGVVVMALPLLFPRIGYAFNAVVLHDYLLTVMSRDHADKAFKGALVELKVPKWRVNSLFFGVQTYSKIIAVKKFFIKE